MSSTTPDGRDPEAEASPASGTDDDRRATRVPDFPQNRNHPGPGSLIVLGVVVLVILGMGLLALRDWYPIISSPAFWNPPAQGNSHVAPPSQG